MRTRGRAGLLVAVALVALWPVPSRPAAGQEVPPEATPLLELLAPIAWPGCADATVATLAVPVVLATLGLPIPSEVSQVTGPVLVVCGSVPQPSGRRTCEADAPVRATIADLTTAVLGSPAPVLVDPAAMVVGEVVVIDDRLPAPGTGVPAIADGVLRCGPAQPATPVEPPAPSPTAPAPDPAPATAAEVASPPPAPPRAVPEAPTAPASAATAAVAPEPPVVAATASLVFPRFSYPIVFAAPLLLLVLGGYVGRSLTRPIETADQIPT